MMCTFHDSNCNGFGDMWWTDKCTYFSIDDYLYTIFDQRRLDIIDQVEHGRTRESTTGYTFTTCVGSFTSPGIGTR